jgi:hypothetical protein
MIAARDELLHAVESFSEVEAEKALALLMEYAPELFGREPTYKQYPVIRGDGQVVMVSIPESREWGEP